MHEQLSSRHVSFALGEFGIKSLAIFIIEEQLTCPKLADTRELDLFDRDTGYFPPRTTLERADEELGDEFC